VTVSLATVPAAHITAAIACPIRRSANFAAVIRHRKFAMMTDAKMMSTFNALGTIMGYLPPRSSDNACGTFRRSVCSRREFGDVSRFPTMSLTRAEFTLLISASRFCARPSLFRQKNRVCRLVVNGGGNPRRPLRGVHHRKVNGTPLRQYGFYLAPEPEFVRHKPSLIECDRPRAFPVEPAESIPNTSACRGMESSRLASGQRMRRGRTRASVEIHRSIRRYPSRMNGSSVRSAGFVAITVTNG
jgi:hypothetical protein